MVFLGWDPAKGRRLLSVYLILNVFTKICMPLRGYLPNPCPTGAVDSRVIRSISEGRVLAARVLPGLLKPAPARILSGLLKLAHSKDLAGGSRFVPLLFVVLALGFSLTLAYLPGLAWCGGARGSDCPCTVIGVQIV